jgi:hypothetical protein
MLTSGRDTCLGELVFGIGGFKSLVACFVGVSGVFGAMVSFPASIFSLNILPASSSSEN